MNTDPKEATAEILEELTLLSAVMQLTELNNAEKARLVRAALVGALSEFKTAIIDETLASQKATADALAAALNVRGAK